MPKTYLANQDEELKVKMDALIENLKKTNLEDCDDMLLGFSIENDAIVSILNTNGNIVKQAYVETKHEGIFTASATSFVYNNNDKSDLKPIEISNESKLNATIGQEFKFPKETQEYVLIITGSLKAVNQAEEAMRQIWPMIFLIIVVVSIFTSIFYVYFITKPIVKLSKISNQMANLDFSWKCDENREDEIGLLQKNLNDLSDKLSSTLIELQSANDKLKDDIERERELERTRDDFFSAVSHELKTPITIVKGQLTGMIDGVGVYKDRDKYLRRSMEVMKQMEELVQELVMISRMGKYENDFNTFSKINISEITEELLDKFEIGFQEKKMNIRKSFDSLTIDGDKYSINKVISNLIANALFYSPEGNEIRIYINKEDRTFKIENTGASIPKESIIHLFEPFYRVEQSRNKQTGGTGLGLYLVKVILEKHSFKYIMENTKDGVCFTIEF
ncbi:sensor histidine kinase [Anaerosphaera multitolerans]|nr:HAMP domain-containing sensor histidine kinase [Anaerosphaera multitolerans]